MDTSIVKQCTCCGQIKTVSEFYSDKRRKFGVGSRCKECHLKTCHKWYENLPTDRKDKYYLASKERFKMNPEKKRDHHRKWVDSNREKMRAFHSKYAKANREKRNEKDRRRQARILNAPGDGITAEQELQLRAEYGNRCIYCGSPGRLELDHIEPISKGGAHDISNAVPACKSCNSRKNDRSLLLFLLSFYEDS